MVSGFLHATSIQRSTVMFSFSVAFCAFFSMRDQDTQPLLLSGTLFCFLFVYPGAWLGLQR